MIDKAKVLEFVMKNGPVLPRDLVREMGGDTMITGAVLSQLVDSKQVMLSYAKIGGSPVYYVKGQEEKLQALYKYLNEKDKNAFDFLKQEKIIKDTESTPLMRVALRNIRDFAKALEVNVSGSREIFWKWYMLPNQEAETIIRKMLGMDTQAKKEQAEEEKQPVSENKEEKEKNREEPEQKKDNEKKQKQEEQKKLSEDEEDRKQPESEFFHKIKSNFSKKNIIILESQEIRKNSEIDLIIRIPSPVGDLRYFCKARDKKKSNDKDISSAYVQGQMKKLPVIYLTTGEITKKAQEMLDNEFSMISVYYI